MRATDTVTERTTALAAWETPLLSALLAADATAETDLAGGGGFRPQDVRFYFLLFTNWMGDDHLRPGADLAPTQLRRVLERLAGEGLAIGERGRPPRWTLTPPGVLHLVELLTDPRRPRRIEEVLLLATVAGSYAETVAARVRQGGRSEERRVRARLDPRAILRAERERLASALADVEARRDAGVALGATARAALAAGATPVEAAARLEASGLPYQLHPMRPLREVLAALPPALARAELEHGLDRRARRLFSPLADELRARIGVLERAEAAFA